MTQAPELYACLHAREFPLQAMLRLRPELRGKPCVVLEGEPPLQQVCALSAKARALGATRGMTRVEIDTFAAIEVLERSPGEEASARDAVLECAGAFSPRIQDCSGDPDFLCVLDIAGTEKLLGSPEELCKALIERLRLLGFAASIAVSGNFHAALAQARGIASANQVQVIPCGEERAALGRLPLAVFDLSSDHAETFAAWGIDTAAMLAELPEDALIARIGQEGKRLRQLARGELPHLFRPVEQAFRLIERMELDTPVELLDSLLFIIGLMLEQLIVRATARIVALMSVTITLSLEGGALHTRTVKPALPINDKQLWLKLMHLDLEAHPPQAAILALTLTAEHGITSKVQLGLFSPQLPEPMRLDVTLARIRAIVGEDRVGRALIQDTHRPDGFALEPFSVSTQAASTSRTIAPSIARQAARQARNSARKLRPAEAVSVTIRGQQPDRFRFREHWYAVEYAYGPWLGSGEWWNPMLWSEEQWDLVARGDSGDLLCCCLTRDLTQDAWRMAALYD